MPSVASSRMDSRRTSSYCSMTTIVVFVAFGLVAVWMMTSTTIVPTAITGDTVEESSGDDNDNNQNEASSFAEKTSEMLINKVEVESSPKDKEDNKDESGDGSKAESFNDINEEETGETNKEAVGLDQDTKTGEQVDPKYKETEEESKEAENDEKIAEEKKSNQDEISDGGKTEDEKDSTVEEKLDQGGKNTQEFDGNEADEMQKGSSSKEENLYSSWKLCQVTAGIDYIPCLDNEAAIKMLHLTGHYEHRERHCPEEPPTCLVALPNGYKTPIRWPMSRQKIWYNNVPHTKLAEVKGHQNWVKVSGEYTEFPGGGTQFTHGALHYIDFIQESLPDIAWGQHSRVVLDVGCGVASFGGYLFDRDVLTMSLAPKDEHEAQVQFALERGIPAISAVMGTKRLTFPSKVFDVIHCARCRVPWHIEGGMLLLELNRLLRPGGYFVWSATPVYRTDLENVGIWQAMTALTKSMCWEMVKKTSDTLNQIGLAIYRKPSDNKCYEQRAEDNPPLCQASDDPDAAWNITLQACMHKLPVDLTSRGKKWPEQWPLRLEKVPYWLNNSQLGVYGKPAPADFTSDYEHWKHVVRKSYVSGMGINWSTVRNVMDMRSVYGGFAATLRDMKVWVMNVVSIDSPDTLPIIYERGLFGMYHDWCESFSTYPRSYDLLHADHLFSKTKKRCQLLPVIVEVDRILRPEGNLIVRDHVDIVSEVESILKSLRWEIRLTYSKDNQGLLCAQKTMWRPN